MSVTGSRDIPLAPLYEPLDESRREVRLIRVEPPEANNDRGILRCAMVKGSLLESQPKYAALSYVWGISYAAEPIIVNGHHVQVTANLAEFLLQYRRADRYAYLDPKFSNLFLWVDALCINQNNTPEKNSQVQMMAAVYRSAQATFCWLGGPAGDSDYTLQTLRDVSQEILMIKSRRAGLLDWLKPEQTHLWQRDLTSGPPATPWTENRFWGGSTRIFERQYWRRAWIAQELVLSQDAWLLCGRRAIPFNGLVDVFGWLRQIDGLPCPSFADTELWRVLSSDWGRRLLLWEGLSSILNLAHYTRVARTAEDSKVPLVWLEFIRYTQTMLATDPRDKVYSVVGLIDRGIRPDYAASTETVYCDFSRQLTAAEKRLDFLFFAGHCTTAREPEFPVQHLFVPSWVPNWEALSKAKHWGEALEPRHADSGGPATPGRSWAFHENILYASGVPCDTISRIHSFIPHTRSGLSSYTDWHRFCDEYFLERGSRPYITGMPALQALGRLYTFDRDPLTGEMLDPTPTPDLLLRMGVLATVWMGSWLTNQDRAANFGLTDMRSICDKFLGQLPPGGLATMAPTSGDSGPFWDAPFWKLHKPAIEKNSISIGRKFFQRTTTHHPFIAGKGYIGFGPDGMQSGDLVCVLFGCGMPVVLRRIGDHYIHIGACYVIGLMEGEAVRGVTEGSCQIKQFAIV